MEGVKMLVSQKIKCLLAQGELSYHCNNVTLMSYNSSEKLII
jgi:hypothetical protein